MRRGAEIALEEAEGFAFNCVCPTDPADVLSLFVAGDPMEVSEDFLFRLDCEPSLLSGDLAADEFALLNVATEGEFFFGDVEELGVCDLNGDAEDDRPGLD